ncbi:MAG TPA: hypothetical protein VK444_07860 [Methanobacteriaceae archaeon]|nr:hypothetical protein [Methanobacteriaceae archaeon]
MKSGNLLIFLLAICFLLSPVYADIIEPGQKNVPIYYVLENVNDYPYYVFLLHGSPSPDLEVLNSSLFTFYKLSTANIFSVKKSDFNQAAVEQMNPTQLDVYFNNNSQVSKSDLELNAIYSTVSDSNPLENATIILKIVSVNPLKIEKSKIIYYYQNGQSDQENYINQNFTPAPSATSNNMYIYYILIPIIAALIILSIIIYHRYQE